MIEHLMKLKTYLDLFFLWVNKTLKCMTVQQQFFRVFHIFQIKTTTFFSMERYVLTDLKMCFGFLRSQRFQKYKFHFCCQYFVWVYTGGHCVIHYTLQLLKSHQDWKQKIIFTFKLIFFTVTNSQLTVFTLMRKYPVCPDLVLQVLNWCFWKSYLIKKWGFHEKTSGLFVEHVNF